MIQATWSVVVLAPGELRRFPQTSYERAERLYRLAACAADAALVRGDGVAVAKTWGER